MQHFNKLLVWSLSSRLEFRAQNPPCRYIHGILVSLTLSGDISCLRYHLLSKIMLPATWKRTNSSAGDSEDLFLFPVFEGNPEGYMSHPGCLNFIRWTTCPWIFSKNLCYMGEREISRHTASPPAPHLPCCSGQQTGSPQPRVHLQQPQWHPIPCSLSRALRIRGAPFCARDFCQAVMQRSEGWTSDIS